MNKKKIIYLSLLILTVLLVTGFYFSYAFFAQKLEEHGKLNLVVGKLDYKIESKELKNNQITVAGNSIKEMIIRVTSLNDIDSKYELYYEIKAGNNVEVLYSGKKDSINDQIKSEETKEMLVTIQNKDSSNATIEFKVEGGFTHNEIKLAKGNHIDKMIESPTVSGGETQWASSRTFALKSNTEITQYEYYINNDKIAPNMEVKATGTTTTATIKDTGTYIYFRAVDKKGNKGEWTEANNLYVDSTQPVITIAKNPNTNTLTATITPQTTLSGYTYSWYQIPEYKYSDNIYGFTVTDKEENGESYYNFRFNKTEGTENSWYHIGFPVYQFTVGNTYKIHFKYRVNQISNTWFDFRHAAMSNDYDTDGLYPLRVANITNGWVDVEMTRSIPTEVTQEGITYHSAPRFEMYTANLAIQAGGPAKSIDFDLKDVWIEEVENASNATTSSQLAQKLTDTGTTCVIPVETSGNRYILKVTTGAGVTGSSNTYITQ